MTIEEELIQLRFIEGLHDGNQKDKVLERLQSNNMALEMSGICKATGNDIRIQGRYSTQYNGISNRRKCNK